MEIEWCGLFVAAFHETVIGELEAALKSPNVES